MNSRPTLVTSPRLRTRLVRAGILSPSTVPDDAFGQHEGQSLLLADQVAMPRLSRILLGRRLWFWPRGRPNMPLVSVVSSRLGRQLEQKPDWFRALRAICSRVAAERRTLLCVPDTAADRFVTRAAQLFATPRVTLHLPDPSMGLRQWWETVRESGPTGNALAPAASPAFLSPPVWGPGGSKPWRELPLADRIAVAVSDEVYALHVRRGGNVQRLIYERLARCGRQPPRLHLALGRGLTPNPTRDTLLDRGAVGWVLFGESGPVESGVPTPPCRRPSRPSCSSSEKLPREEPWDLLTHCTRRTPGPWPDQTERDFLDELILSRPAADRSPLATLRRILTSRRLLASAKTIRGGTPVISFTAVPLWELQELRVFRPHRGTWDFEPYGICIGRQVLRSRGARPVRYAAPEEWDDLPPHDRPFFQVDHSLTRSGTMIDWRLEQEWRLVGDLDLTEIRPDDARVFVPSLQEAERLQPHSMWPVVPLGDRASLARSKPGFLL